jgi:PEP-CTERM motif-containing protein
MRKSFLIVAFVFASIAARGARADSYSTPVGPLYYPDGATITSVTDNAFPVSQPGVWGLYYSFADGTGETFDPVVDGDVGYVFFSTPVTSVTFNYIWNFEAFDVTFYNSSGAPFETFSSSGPSGTDTYLFDTGVTKMQWIGSDAAIGQGGITSLSYTEDGVSTPEPGSLALLAIGLFALVFFKLRPTPRLPRRSSLNSNFPRSI